MTKYPGYEPRYIDDMQRWAIEQVIKLHDGAGLGMDVIIREANTLLDYILVDEEKE